MPQTIAHRPLPSGRGRSQYVYRKNPKQTAQGQTHVTGIRSAVVSIVAAVKRSIRRPDQFELLKKKQKKQQKAKNGKMAKPFNATKRGRRDRGAENMEPKKKQTNPRLQNQTA